MGKTLLDDDTLADYYTKYATGFRQEPGVEVTGAGAANCYLHCGYIRSAQVDGWYKRREASQGPPSWSNHKTRDDWIQYTENRPWFENNSGGCIHWHGARRSWYCRDTYSEHKNIHYEAREVDSAPRSTRLPTEGWAMNRYSWNHRGEVPKFR